MIELSPKAQFAQLTDTHRVFVGMARNTDFQTACVFAMSEFSKLCPNADQMKGAQVFLRTLLNLAEKDEPSNRSTFKALDHITEPEKK